MSEGQHIENYITGQKFVNQQKCLAFVKEARASYSPPKPNTSNTKNTSNIEIVEKSSGSTSTSTSSNSGPFSGPVDNYNTIEKLDIYIKTFLNGPETETDVAGPISDTIPSLCSKKGLDEFQKDLCSWNRMVSSGNKFDCLIHSFLTMVSPHFRKLSVSLKDTLASAFRRTLFLKFPLVERSADRDTVKEQIPATYVYLTDSELQILSLTYKINIIVFEQAKSEKVGGQIQKMPATITPIDNFEKSDVFYLLSNRNKHYEAVKAKNSYTINRKTMLDILEKFPQEFTGEAKPTCKYPGTSRNIEEGDIIVYDGELCMVVERRFDGDPPVCDRLFVEVLETEEKKEVPTKDISPYNAGGGGRKRNTRRRMRKQKRKTRKQNTHK